MHFYFSAASLTSPSPKPTPRFTCLDFETTSQHVADARIVEAAVVDFTTNGDTNTTLHTRIDPCIPIPPDATRIHGIRDVDVVTAPMPAATLPRLLHCITGTTLVGYNIEAYDLEVLRNECVRHGLLDAYDAAMCTIRVVDVMAWAQTMARYGQRGLGQMCARFGVELGHAHSAVADATATGRLLLAMLRAGAVPLDALA